jgi:hypothetical protein
MIFEVVTLFPEMFSSVLSASLLGKAAEKGALTVHLTDPRAFTTDKHHSVDDTPYGGGAGMVLGSRWSAISGGRRRAAAHRCALPPGRAAHQAGERLPRCALVLVCGRYEGFDERVRAFVGELSLGFVLTGGELAAHGGRRGGDAGRARQRRCRSRARAAARINPRPPGSATAVLRVLWAAATRIDAGAACRLLRAPAPDLFARLAQRRRLGAARRRP